MTTSYPLRLTNTLPLANSTDYGKWYRNYPKNYNRSYLLCSLIFLKHIEEVSEHQEVLSFIPIVMILYDGTLLHLKKRVLLGRSTS